MRRRCFPTLFLTLLMASTPAAASRQASTVTRVAAPSLETASGVRVRTDVSVRYGQVPQRRALAWSRFLADAGATWQASWDQATGVPSRIFGRGVAAPGAVRDPAAAERHARAFLAAHIDLLAPGSSASDFVLV